MSRRLFIISLTKRDLVAIQKSRLRSSTHKKANRWCKTWLQKFAQLQELEAAWIWRNEINAAQTSGGMIFWFVSVVPQEAVGHIVRVNVVFHNLPLRG